MWWRSPLLLEPGRPVAGWISEFEVSQGYLVRSYLKVHLPAPDKNTQILLSQHIELEGKWHHLELSFSLQVFLYLTWLPVLHVRSRTLYP